MVMFIIWPVSCIVEGWSGRKDMKIVDAGLFCWLESFQTDFVFIGYFKKQQINVQGSC